MNTRAKPFPPQTQPATPSVAARTRPNRFMRSVVMPSVVLALLGWVFSLFTPVRLVTFGRAQAPLPGPADLAVVTYNLNFGLPGHRGTVEACLRAGRNADVVFLQETGPEWQAALSAEYLGSHPYQYWSPNPEFPAGGAAILSRFPLLDRLESESSVGWFDALIATVNTPQGPIRLVNVHLEPVASLSALLSASDHHRQEIESHLDLAEAVALPMIVAGDFNEEHGGALAWLRDQELNDALETYAPAETTWRWEFDAFTARLQLDHIIHSAELEAMSAEVLHEGGSDHLPVRVRFRFRPQS